MREDRNEELEHTKEHLAERLADGRRHASGRAFRSEDGLPDLKLWSK
jgi:hypothetical protein